MHAPKQRRAMKLTKDNKVTVGRRVPENITARYVPCSSRALTSCTSRRSHYYYYY